MPAALLLPRLGCSGAAGSALASVPLHARMHRRTCPALARRVWVWVCTAKCPALPACPLQVPAWATAAMLDYVFTDDRRAVWDNNRGTDFHTLLRDYASGAAGRANGLVAV